MNTRALRRTSDDRDSPAINCGNRHVTGNDPLDIGLNDLLQKRARNNRLGLESLSRLFTFPCRGGHAVEVPLPDTDVARRCHMRLRRDRPDDNRMATPICRFCHDETTMMMTARGPAAIAFECESCGSRVEVQTTQARSERVSY